MRFGFLIKRHKAEAVPVGVELAAVVRARGGHVVVAADPAENATVLPGVPRVALDELASQIDALVVLGGDGTFLFGAALVADQGVPLLGINLGSLGFMTSYALADARAAVESVLAGQVPIEERLRLRVAIRSGGEEREARNAVNEAAISQRSLPRLIDLSAAMDGALIANFKADGLIVATSTGSTAYSLAAGGPILAPSVDAMVLTPVCPHTLTNRPVVLPASGRVTITNTSAAGVVLSVDGQWSRPVEAGDVVEIRRADQPLRMYRAADSFFSTLQRKLSWGER